MPPKPSKTYSSVQDVLNDVLDSDFEVLSGSEYGEISSEEEGLINEGFDPKLDDINATRYFVYFVLNNFPRWCWYLKSNFNEQTSRKMVKMFKRLRIDFKAKMSIVYILRFQGNAFWSWFVLLFLANLIAVTEKIKLLNIFGVPVCGLVYWFHC